MESMVIRRIAERTCQWCGASFFPMKQTRRFCSNTCSGQYLHSIKSLCPYCHKTFSKIRLTRHEPHCPLNPINYRYCKQCGRLLTTKKPKIFCSPACSLEYNTAKTTKCQYCGKALSKRHLSRHEPKCHHNPANNLYCRQCGRILTLKSTKVFCSKSCASRWHNRHSKPDGSHRSKLEEWIEQHLATDFPGLDIHCNDRDVLDGLELDFYVPALQCAVEINGIYHYKPIRGDEPFQRQIAKDQKKQEQCKQKGIALLVLDTSKHRFGEKTNFEYYVVIKNHLAEARLSTATPPQE